MLKRSGIRRFASATTLGVAALALGPIVADAILVAPHAVFMDHRTRTGQVYLVNSGTEPEEVGIELKYGYPDADSTGNVYIHFFDAPTPDQHSAAEWIRAFPRRVVVPPGAQQVVRLLATPPADLPDGEYWSRLIVTSHGAPVPVAGADSAVRAQITLEVRSILSLTYRKGVVQTGLTLRDFQATLRRDSLVVWLDLERTGNAAWLGTARLGLRDTGGQVAEHFSSQVAIYSTPQRRRLAFPVTGVGPGVYTMTLELSTAREDIPQGNVLPAETIQRSVALEVPVR